MLSKLEAFGLRMLGSVSLCDQIVEGVWYNDQKCSFFNKLADCSEVLPAWASEVTGSFKNRIYQCKKIIKFLKWRRDTNLVRLFGKFKQQLPRCMLGRRYFESSVLKLCG